MRTFGLEFVAAILTLLFIVLKVLGVLPLEWVFVISPLWIVLIWIWLGLPH